MLKEWVLIAMLTTGQPVQEITDGETCHALYDAMEQGAVITRDMEDGTQVSLGFISCIPLDVFNQVGTERPE